MYYNYSGSGEFHPNDMYKFDQTIFNFEPFVQMNAILLNLNLTHP